MKKYYTYLAGTAAALAVPSVALAQTPAPTEWVEWMHPGIGWGGMMFGGLMMVAFWGVVILLIVLLLRGNSGSSNGDQRATRSRAEEIAKERLAKGEIDHAEYDAMIHKLGA